MNKRDAVIKAELIWRDLTDRGGFDLDVDEDVHNEILATWANIILHKIVEE